MSKWPWYKMPGMDTWHKSIFIVEFGKFGRSKKNVCTERRASILHHNSILQVFFLPLCYSRSKCQTKTAETAHVKCQGTRRKADNQCRKGRKDSVSFFSIPNTVSPSAIRCTNFRRGTASLQSPVHCGLRNLRVWLCKVADPPDAEWMSQSDNVSLAALLATKGFVWARAPQIRKWQCQFDSYQIKSWL